MIDETKLRKGCMELVKLYGMNTPVRQLVERIRAAIKPDAPATPDRTGTWWVDSTDVARMAVIDNYDLAWGLHRCHAAGGDKDSDAGGKAIRERDIGKLWLPIPPRPTVPEGYRLTGKVRGPKVGEQYVGLDMSAGKICWRCTCFCTRSDGTPVHIDEDLFGGRRWIVEKVQAEPDAPAEQPATGMYYTPADVPTNPALGSGDFLAPAEQPARSCNTCIHAATSAMCESCDKEFSNWESGQPAEQPASEVRCPGCGHTVAEGCGCPTATVVVSKAEYDAWLALLAWVPTIPIGREMRSLRDKRDELLAAIAAAREAKP